MDSERKIICDLDRFLFKSRYEPRIGRLIYILQFFVLLILIYLFIFYILKSICRKKSIIKKKFKKFVWENTLILIRIFPNI